MSIENNTTSSDIQKPKILTPDEKIAKDKKNLDRKKYTLKSNFRGGLKVERCRWSY